MARGKAEGIQETLRYGMSRRVRILQIATLLVVALLFLLGLAQATTSRTLLAKVERVSDGETITAFTSDQTKLRIRLLGIDAPEAPQGKKPGQPFGEESRQYLSRLIGGRTVRVHTYGQDGSGRILAVIFLGPVNVNLEMVQQGMAEMFRGAPCKAYCRDLRVAELNAKRHRVGMWARGSA
jgi:endonuclease YncB( thermonuclease family)